MTKREIIQVLEAIRPGDISIHIWMCDAVAVKMGVSIRNGNHTIIMRQLWKDRDKHKCRIAKYRKNCRWYGFDYINGRYANIQRTIARLKKEIADASEI